MIIRKKRIYLNKAKTKYCIVRLYKEKTDMQAGYKKFRPGEPNYEKIAGCHCAYTKIMILKDGSEVLSPETGTLFLCYERAGAGIVSHEFLHAVLWAWKHHSEKAQHPIVIKDMEDEEDICYALTRAVSAFYSWMYSIEDVFKE